MTRPPDRDGTRRLAHPGACPPGRRLRRAIDQFGEAFTTATGSTAPPSGSWTGVVTGSQLGTIGLLVSGRGLPAGRRDLERPQAALLAGILAFGLAALLFLATEELLFEAHEPSIHRC